MNQTCYLRLVTFRNKRWRLVISITLVGKRPLYGSLSGLVESQFLWTLHFPSAVTRRPTTVYPGDTTEGVMFGWYSRVVVYDWEQKISPLLR